MLPDWPKLQRRLLLAAESSLRTCEPQAEALYLRHLLASGLPPGPLADAAPRYLATLEGNSSWTFAQRKHAVEVRGASHIGHPKSHL